MNAPTRRGACPSLAAPMQTGDGLLVRLRPVAGGLTPAQLSGLAAAARRFGNGMLEVTARGSLQLRGLSATTIDGLAGAVTALGIAVRSGVPVETGPLAGLDADEVADPTPLAEEIRVLAREAGLAARLGPKVSVVVDGGGRLPMDAVIADVRLTAVDAERWEIAVGGNGASARRLGVVGTSDAAEAAGALLEAIAAKGLTARGRDIGGEELRGVFASGCVSGDVGARRAPLCPAGHLPHEGGDRSAARPSPIAEVPARARRAKLPISPLRGEMAGRPEGGNVERDAASQSASPVGLFPLKHGGAALGLALAFGQIEAEALASLAEAAAALGAADVHPAPGRALLVLGLDSEARAGLRARAEMLGLVTDAGDPRLSVVACAGAPACASGRIATRALAAEIAGSAAELFDGSLVLHVSGCEKRCAEPARAGLTLLGTEGGRCNLLVEDRKPALAIGSVAVDEAAAAIGRLKAAFASKRKPGERASAFVARQNAEGLARMMRRDGQ